MPSVRLDNLSESLLYYWFQLSKVTREMIKFKPDEENPLKIDGEVVHKDLEKACKLIKIFLIQVIIIYLVCEDHVINFKVHLRFLFSVRPDPRWDSLVARCILILWEVCQVCTYHRSYDSPVPLLKLTSFRMNGKLKIQNNFERISIQKY